MVWTHGRVLSNPNRLIHEFFLENKYFLSYFYFFPFSLGIFLLLYIIRLSSFPIWGNNFPISYFLFSINRVFYFFFFFVYMKGCNSFLTSKTWMSKNWIFWMFFYSYGTIFYLLGIWQTLLFFASIYIRYPIPTSIKIKN
jgi:hypothetical protein